MRCLSLLKYKHFCNVLNPVITVSAISDNSSVEFLSPGRGSCFEGTSVDGERFDAVSLGLDLQRLNLLSPVLAAGSSIWSTTDTVGTSLASSLGDQWYSPTSLFNTSLTAASASADLCLNLTKLCEGGSVSGAGAGSGANTAGGGGVGGDEWNNEASVDHRSNRLRHHYTAGACLRLSEQMLTGGVVGGGTASTCETGSVGAPPASGRGSRVEMATVSGSSPEKKRGEAGTTSAAANQKSQQQVG